MAFYRVMLPNPFYKVGSFVEDDKEGFLQQIYMSNELEHYRGPAGYFGLMYPLREVRPYLLRIQKRGLDKYRGGAFS